MSNRDKAWRALRDMRLHPEHDALVLANANAERITCGRYGCVCGHRGCVAGWIDQVRDDGTRLGHDVAVPCPICRSAMDRHFTQGGTPNNWRSNGASE